MRGSVSAFDFGSMDGVKVERGVGGGDWDFEERYRIRFAARRALFISGKG